MTREELNPLFNYSNNNTGSSRSNNGIETHRFDAARNLSLPSVTVPRRKRQTHKPCGRVACGMKMLIALIPIYFYRQIIDVSLSTDMFSSPVIRHDYSDVRSVHDLSSSKVKQWCQRNVYDCKCKDPMIGYPRESESTWQRVHAENVELASTKKPDVVFFGDGLIERWKHHQAVFDSFFSRNSGGGFDGIALGISGDTVSQNEMVALCG